MGTVYAVVYAIEVPADSPNMSLAAVISKASQFGSNGAASKSFQQSLTSTAGITVGNMTQTIAPFHIATSGVAGSPGTVRSPAPAPPAPAPGPSKEEEKSDIMILIVAIVGGSVVVLLVAVGAFWCKKRLRKGEA